MALIVRRSTARSACRSGSICTNRSWREMKGAAKGCGVAVVTTDGLRQKNSQRAAMAGRRHDFPMRWVLALATDQHKLDDGEQPIEIDGLTDHFLGTQRPRVLEQFFVVAPRNDNDRAREIIGA